MNHLLSEPATETILAQNAEAIRALGKRVIGDIIEIGRLLTEAKQIAGHGKWLPWIEREFGWSRQTADNFINVFEFETSDKVPNFSNLSLPVSGLYMLAAPSTPEEAREAVIARAQNGERLLVKDIRNQIDEARKKQTAEPAQAEGGFPIYGSCAGGRVVTERTSTKPTVNAADAPGPAPQTNFGGSKPTEFDDNIDPKDLARTLERALEAANAFSNWSKREPIPERRKKQIAKQVEAMREVVSEFHRLLRWEPRRQKKLNDDGARTIAVGP